MCMKMTLIYTICAGCACQTIVSGFKSGKILAREYICILISFFFTEYALSLCRLKRDYKSWKINCTIYIYMYCYLYFVHKIGLVQQHNSDRYRPRGATQAIHDGRVAALTMLRLLLSRRVPPFPHALRSLCMCIQAVWHTSGFACVFVVVAWFSFC